VKLFVTASEVERARRRHQELRRRGESPTFDEVLLELRERDRRDAERAVAPLRAAEDAWVLDTTELDADAAFDAAARHIEAAAGAIARSRR
jgi:cytidylate kinase